jgi:hypothetical protein
MRDDDTMAEVMLNSRSDRPFHSMDEVSAGMYAFYRVWPRPHGGLFAGLIYFPFERIIPEEVMPVSVPFPFLMYLHAAPGLFIMAGIPPYSGGVRRSSSFSTSSTCLPVT